MDFKMHVKVKHNIGLHKIDLKIAKMNLKNH